MMYSLGSLRIDAQAAWTALAPQLHDLPRRSIGSFMQQVHGFMQQLERQPDLLAVLDAEDPDRPWLEALAATADDLRAAGRPLSLACCLRTTGVDGQCSVMLHDRSLARSVQTGDTVTAGVAVLRSPAAGLVVMPRVFRKVCSNGAVVDVGAGCVREVEVAEVGPCVRACLQPAGIDVAVARFRRAAGVAVDDLEALLTRARTVTPRAELAARWRRAGDASVFGLVNAATALAHGEQVPERRLDRERDAERLLAAIECGSAVTLDRLSLVHATT
ncbi:MAG TPA: hypothetical protein VFT55_09320 [Planctomycetota bacterium]|nr:hypothetical protein [Planctomycetota bacterium]